MYSFVRVFTNFRTANKQTNNGVTTHYNAKNHPQRAGVGIFVGIPCGHAGYMIWEPHKQTMRVSADVSFDKKFVSMGPSMHHAFAEALPITRLTDSLLINADKLFEIDPDEDQDHFGPPQLSFDTDTPSDGYLVTALPDSAVELSDLTTTPPARKKLKAAFRRSRYNNTVVQEGSPFPIDVDHDSSLLYPEPLLIKNPDSVAPPVPDRPLTQDTEVFVDPLLLQFAATSTKVPLPDTILARLNIRD